MAKASQKSPTAASVELPILRPTEFPDSEHPDQRPCPSWCWIAADNPDKYDHEVDADHIQVATHTMDAIDTRATLYNGDHSYTQNMITTAKIESRLEQAGAGTTTVRVSLRTYAREQGADGNYHNAMKYYESRLRLTVEDARELACVLTYLVQTADAG